VEEEGRTNNGGRRKARKKAIKLEEGRRWGRKTASRTINPPKKQPDGGSFELAEQWQKSPGGSISPSSPEFEKGEDFLITRQ